MKGLPAASEFTNKLTEGSLPFAVYIYGRFGNYVPYNRGDKRSPEGDGAGNKIKITTENGVKFRMNISEETDVGQVSIPHDGARQCGASYTAKGMYRWRSTYTGLR